MAPAFNEERWDVETSGATHTVAALFWAEWCIPSRSARQTFAEVLARTPGVRGGTVDAEANRGLVARHAIRGLPTLLLLREGREQARRVGLMTADDLLRFLQQVPSAAAAP